MDKIIVIVGPTGIGKTRLSIELAKIYHGEIINADAMQVYKGLDIGTAKVTEKEKEGIPHHLFDIKNVEEEYSIYHYQMDCREKIKEVFSRKKTPILVGGTGLYIKAALYDYKLDKLSKNTLKYDSFSTEDLYQRLIKCDKECVGKIDANNRRRIINALIYSEEHHESITKNKTDNLLYDAIFVGLTTERTRLYQIIHERVDKMIEIGLIEEVRYFYDKKIRSRSLLSGIGYKELYEYFDKEITLEEAIDTIKKNSRRYAKRQYTFFRHQLPVHWFETNYQDFDVTIENVQKYIDKMDKL